MFWQVWLFVDLACVSCYQSAYLRLPYCGPLRKRKFVYSGISAYWSFRGKHVVVTNSIVSTLLIQKYDQIRTLEDERSARAIRCATISQFRVQVGAAAPHIWEQFSNSVRSWFWYDVAWLVAEKYMCALNKSLEVSTPMIPKDSMPVHSLILERDYCFILGDEQIS